MNRWIFVISDSFYEFDSRMKTKQWPIYDKTINRNKLEVGDLLIFYKAGIDGQKFIGNATIKTNLKKKTDSVSFLEMDEISVWKKPVIVEEVIVKLEFIKNKDSWGSYFQGGVKAISKEDYSTIIEKVS